ncbi:structural protein, partial [Xenorhabdus bovienii]|uniref:structural protein n=1 Tax=Xenorhabdus bovienii TaxID=40576 RepID=UPI0023B252D4
MSRGIRNNNPGNIDHNSANKWQGQLLHDPKIESRFCRFESPEYGIRALMKLLCNYHKKGYQTVAKMIDRWAPTNENNTSAYINGVAKALGVDPHQVITVDKVTLIVLAKSIIRHENG